MKITKRTDEFPLLAQSGHRSSLGECPLLGEKRTCAGSDNHAYWKLWPSDSFVRSVSVSGNCHQFFIGQIVRVGWA